MIGLEKFYWPFNQPRVKEVLHKQRMTLFSNRSADHTIPQQSKHLEFALLMFYMWGKDFSILQRRHHEYLEM